MVGQLQKSLDNSGVAGMWLTDLSKALNCLRHDLVTAKLTACGFDQPSLWDTTNPISFFQPEKYYLHRIVSRTPAKI